jgi:hypothetical protein
MFIIASKAIKKLLESTPSYTPSTASCYSEIGTLRFKS